MGSPMRQASDVGLQTFLTAGVASKPLPCHADKLEARGSLGEVTWDAALPRLSSGSGPTTSSSLAERLHRQTGVSLAELQALEQEGVLDQIPRDKEGGLTSVGSIKHAEGECAPCLFWHRKACVKGIRCTYCHIAHEGLQKKRIRPCKQTRKRLREGKEPILQGRLREANGAGYNAAGMQGGDSSSEDSSFQADDGRLKSARTDLPAGIFLDAKGNSRPCWLRDDDLPCYGNTKGGQSGQPGHGAMGACQSYPPQHAHQYGSQPQYSTQHQYGAQSQYGVQPQHESQSQRSAQHGCSAPPSGAPREGYGMPAFPSYGRQH